jgi:hypothetical protein
MPHWVHKSLQVSVLECYIPKNKQQKKKKKWGGGRKEEMNEHKNNNTNINTT